MRSPTRIAWGHFLVALGLLVRRVSLLVGILVLAALIAARVPFGADISPAWVIGAPLAALLGIRLLAVGFAALGWLVFPAEHREVLSEITSEPPALEPPEQLPQPARGRYLSTR